MRQISKLLLAALVSGFAANAAGWHSSYPHFLPGDTAKAEKPAKPAKPKKPAKPAEPPVPTPPKAQTDTVPATVPVAPTDTVTPAEKSEVTSAFKERLKTALPRITRLGAMPADTDAQRAAKEKVRDGIVEDLNKDVMNLTSEQSDQLQVITRRLKDPKAVGRPDDEKTFLGEKKAEGSRSYCRKIIIYINNIINE